MDCTKTELVGGLAVLCFMFGWVSLILWDQGRDLLWFLFGV